MKPMEWTMWAVVAALAALSLFLVLTASGAEVPLGGGTKGGVEAPRLPAPAVPADPPKPDKAICNLPIDLAAMKRSPAITVGGLFLLGSDGAPREMVVISVLHGGAVTVLNVMDGEITAVMRVGPAGERAMWRDDALLDEQFSPRTPSLSPPCRWIAVTPPAPLR